MPRRMISSEVLHHPVLMQMPLSATLLWIGLILEADSDGCVCCSTTWLHRRIFATRRRPSHADLATFIDTLRAAEMLTTYQLGGVTYCQITNFHSWQKLKKQKTRRKRIEENRREDDEPPLTPPLGGSVEARRSTPPPDRDAPPAPPPKPTPQQRTAEALVTQLSLGWAKAMAYAERGVTEADVEAWAAYSRQHGQRLALHHLKSKNSPTEIPDDAPRDRREADGSEW